MALIKCTECGHKVSDKAKTCPKCGVDVEAMKQAMLLKKQKSKKRWRKVWFIIFCLLLAFWALGKYAQYKESQLPPEIRQAREQVRAEQREQERIATERRRQQAAQAEARRVQEEEEKRCMSGSTAFVMSQQYVRARLKAPSTAKFPSGSRDYQTQYMGDCKHRVVAYVDSQNSFGAMIRTPYYAEMQYIRNSGNQWRLLDLKVQN